MATLNRNVNKLNVIQNGTRVKINNPLEAAKEWLPPTDNVISVKLQDQTRNIRVFKDAKEEFSPTETVIIIKPQDLTS